MPFLLLTIIAVFVSAMNLWAQEINEQHFTRYTAADGLSDSYIGDIIQDSTGYLWVATNRGLNRFDGHQFKTFYKNSRYNPIPDNTIYSMSLFGSDIYLATSDGAQVISTKSLQQTNLQVPTTEPLRYWSNAVYYCRPDGVGNIGVSTKTGFYIFSRDGKIKRRYDHYTEKDIGHTWMLFGNRLYNLPNGNILQQNSSGLLIYDSKKNEFSGDSVKFSRGLKKVLKILTEEKTSFFSISRNQLLVLNTKKNRFDLVNIETGLIASYKPCFSFTEEMGWQTKIHNLYDNKWAVNSKNKGFYILKIDTVNGRIECLPEKQFAGHTCNSIFVDRQKRLWVGTSKGLFMEKVKPKIIKTFIALKESDGQAVSSLFATRDKLFTGTTNRKIIVFDKNSKEIIKEIHLPATYTFNNVVKQIVKISKDTVWLTINKEIWWLNTLNFHHGQCTFKEIDDSTNTINFLYRDRSGSIWISSNRLNTIFNYNPATQVFKTINQKAFPKLQLNVINAVAEDKDGKLWMSGDALVKWDVIRQQVDTIIRQLPTQASPKKGYIVMTDDYGDVWAMVNDDGYARLTGRQIHNRPQNLSYYRSGNLLPTLLNNKVYLPTNEGIGYYDIQNNRGVLFTVNDGLPDELGTSNRFISDPSDSSTWFACGNIICNLSSSPGNYAANSPPLTVSELSINNEHIINYPGDKIELKHNQNDLRLHFSGINYTDPGNMRYAYRFKNSEDSTWIEAGREPQILLSNIGAGLYKLQVKVYAYDNKWPEQIKEMSITVKPPIWKTTWFDFAAFIVLVGSVYFLYRNRVKQIEQKANLDKLLAQTEMKALHAQMNPHFIFNCLNSIREMVLKNENIQASRYLGKFAQLIRITLDQSSRPMISLKETISYLERYLEMEQIRTDRFIYTLKIEEELDMKELVMPPMLIQPFIENAIWHGSPRKGIIKINIHFLHDGKDLVCVIDDTGIGINNSLKQKGLERNHKSVGIENIRERMRVLNEKYGTDCRLEIMDKSLLNGSNGTLVTLHFPIQKSIYQP